LITALSELFPIFYHSVRNESSVANIASPNPCMPSGMQPIYFKKLAFLWNAEGIYGFYFLPSCIPGIASALLYFSIIHRFGKAGALLLS